MTSTVSQLIGLHSTQPNNSLPSTSALPTSRTDPDDYPTLAPAAKRLGKDVRTAYSDALEATERDERVQDRYFLDRAKDFVELNEQVETSASLLTDLSSFLSTFQSDLSAVSGHISELQGRSKMIEGRLESRKSVERSLHPYLASITISPSLIRTIIDTDVDDAWIPAVSDLDAKLGAIRSGPRVEGRKTLDAVAESLRLHASAKILNHFINLLKPFTLSVAPSLPTLQSSVLLPLKPLFDFLRRHAARQAHEFQKAYVATIRWYYETGFRRYVRALEKLRTKTVDKVEPIGVVAAGVDGSLALLSKKSAALSGSTASEQDANSTSTPLDHSQMAGPGIILAFTIADKNFRPTPEALFRSASLVLADNAQTEYEFLSTFFGQHSSLQVVEARTPSLFSTATGSWGQPGDSTNGEGTAASSVTGEQDEGQVGGMAGGVGKGPESDSGHTSVADREEKSQKLQRSVVDTLWKGVMEPAQEYVRNFSSALVDPAPPSPISLLAMIRLNESIITHLIDATVCPSMENHLISIRMQLWPAFAKMMNGQVESLRKINGTLPSGGVFGGKGSGVNVKDSVVQVIALRYVDMFNAFVTLSGDQDEEMVFSSLLRLRHELDKLFAYQASKIPDPPKQRAFLATHYEELLSGLSTGLSSHTRSQAEVAHYREEARRATASG